MRRWEHDARLDSIRVVQARTEEIARPFAPVWRPTSEGPGFDVACTDPEIMGRPVRRLVRKSAGRCFGYFASVKNDEMQPWESILESEALATSETDPRVTRYVVQPLMLEYVLDPGVKRPRRYVPDIWLWCGRTPHVVEVRHASIAASPAWLEKFKLFGAFFRRHGIAYHVWDETFIRVPVRLANARTLLRCRPQSIAQAQIDVVYDHMKTNSAASIGELVQLLACEDAEQVVHALLLRSFLLTDLYQPLSDTTRVLWNGAGS